MNTNDPRLNFLAGGGAVGALLRATDWSATPLGAPAGWCEALKTLVGVMQASNQPMFVAWGPRRTLIYNARYAEVLARKHPAAMGRDFLEVWHEIRADLEPIVAQAYAGESVQMDDIELLMERRGYPEETHFSFFYSPVRDPGGSVAGFFCACTDITDRVVAQRQLQASEARYRGVLSNMAEAFALYDRDFRLLDLNDEALRLESRGREDMVGRTHWELYPGTHGSELGRMYRQCMADGQPRTLEHCYEWEPGRCTWLEARAYRTPEGLAIFYRDISARRELAAEAAASAERVRLALDAGAIVGTWVWDLSDDTFLADERFARSFGLDPARCHSGLTVDEAVRSIHPQDWPRVSVAMDAAIAAGGPFRCEYRVRQADGQYRWIEANGHVEIRADGRKRFPGVLLDIGQRRQAEAERDQAHDLLRTIMEAVPGVVYAKDLQGRMLVANRGAIELIGKPPEAFIGRTDAEFLDDKQQAALVMANDRRIMDSGVAEQIEEAIRLPDGTPALWLSTKAPMRGADGRVVGLVGSSVDISERKRMEENLRDSDQRKSEFLAVLSHELRNPLAPIRNGLYVLQHAPPGSPQAARALSVMRRQTDHLTRLVDDLLDMTRISRGKIDLRRQRTDLRDLVRQSCIDAQPQAREHGIELGASVPGAPVWVEADGTRISQIIGNLLNNAIKFTPAGGSIRLGLRCDGAQARLEVRDSGSGMEPESIARMFEPFAQGDQSASRMPGGLGLGLALVRSLVEMHGGAVSAHSAGAGSGSSFVVLLPLAQAPGPDDPASPS